MSKREAIGTETDFSFCSQELLVILFPFTVAIHFQPKIGIMTAPALTVLFPSKEPGGMKTATTQI